MLVCSDELLVSGGLLAFETLGKCVDGPNVVLDDGRAEKAESPSEGDR